MYPERTRRVLARSEGFEPPTPRFEVSWSITSRGFPLSPAMPQIIVLRKLWCIVVPAGARGFRSGGSSVVPCGGISTGQQHAADYKTLGGRLKAGVSRVFRLGR